MSYFSAPTLAKDPDMAKIRSYIMQLNQQLQYSLSSLDPEDNFSQEFLVSYQETDKTISQIEISMNGFMSEFKNLEAGVSTQISTLNNEIKLKVSAEELCSEISMAPGTIAFKTGYLTIDAKNFKLSKDGTAEFSGNITGGSININDRFVVSETGSTKIDSGAYTGSIQCSGPLATETLITYGNCDVDGSISCQQMKVTGTVTCETLYQSSDERLKEHIEDIPEETALRIVLGLKPVEFSYIGNEERQIGFLAQDVNALQETIGTNLPLTDLGEDGYYRIPYSSYGALYAGAIKSQQRQIEELERKLQ